MAVALAIAVALSAASYHHRGRPHATQPEAAVAPRRLAQLPRACVTAGAKKQKAHFEAYHIPDRDLAGGIFPPPDRRDAIRVHKKHLPEGAPVGKAPPGFLERWMPGLDASHKGLKVLHLDPPVLVVDDFATPADCDELIALTRTDDAFEVQSATFSALTASARTSTTWYTRHTCVPTLVGRVCQLTGVHPSVLEEPQIVRYQLGQRFSWHFDEVPASLLENGGQRRGTLLVYLSDVTQGGGTAFRDLGVTVQPRKGRALLFFPSDVDGAGDDRTLHAGEPVISGEKWIAQFWLHERAYRPGVVPDAEEDAAVKAFDMFTRRSGTAPADRPSAATPSEGVRSLADVRESA